jgi:sugar/nucleoside kinase (ribokinase family)
MFVIIGTANVDLIVSGFDQMPVVMGDEFTTSSLVFCDAPLQMVLGGNGGNCAYVLAGLGAPTALCSAVGQDDLGRIVRGWLHTQGVDLTGLRHHPQRATAFTTIVSDRNRNRLAFHHPGALAAFDFADIPTELLTKANVVLATSYTIMPKLRSAGWSQALALAQAQGAITAVDIGPAIGQPAQVAELQALMPYVDYWLTNRHELAVCTGCDEVAAGAALLLTAGARTVVVKLGKGGAAVYRQDSHFTVPAFAVAVRSTVGAGDSFNAGLLYGLQQGWPLAQAVRFGNAVAALVIASEHGILGCPPLTQVNAFLQADL